MESVKKFAQRVIDTTEEVHVLINNAETMMIDETITEDGNEKQMQSNYIGHFLLTKLLIPNLTKTNSSRIINITNIAHAWGKLLSCQCCQLYYLI